MSDLMANVGYKPIVPVEWGVANLVNWYREYCHV